MAKKKELSEDIKFLKEKVKDGKGVIGTDRVVKELKKGSLKQVYLASNVGASVEKDIQTYAGLANTPVIKLGLNNEELGVLCKKNFIIAVLGIIEE
jgi:ribosomal protein L30E